MQLVTRIAMTTKTPTIPRDNAAKLAIFRRCFSGLTHVYGSYDPASGVVHQVKAFVSDAVLLNHLTGRQPYGVYLLVGDRTKAIAADFDQDDLAPPMEMIRTAAGYGLSAYIERSKRKGYHVWFFLSEQGVLAWKARAVLKLMLEEIGKPDTEVFPKQDRLVAPNQYGNFINAPLFYRSVREDRTVFLDPQNPTRPSSDQWDLLDSVERVGESKLDELIEINDLTERVTPTPPARKTDRMEENRSFILPPCAQRMLNDGVSANQRVSCFRLAVQFKRIGLPFDIALPTLRAWAMKNTPPSGKRIITPEEIESQTRSAYEGAYRSFGCEDPAITPYCDPACPVNTRKHSP